MRIGLRNIMLGAAAVGLALAGADTARAGQAGSTTNIGGSSSTTSHSMSLTGVGSISDTANVITGSSSINSTLVKLSLQITDDGYHGYSPSQNMATFSGSLTNTATIGTTTGSNGIVSVQQTAGNANVSVHANTLLDAGALVGVIGGSGADNSAANGATAVMVLNPAFAISNSALAARVLAVEAMSGAITAAGGSSAVTAIDIIGRNTFEMSPERNLATFTGNLSNVATIGGSNGITQVQQQLGNANVQAGFNTIVFSTGSGSGLPGFH